jgi:hypothetical protein
VFIESSLHPIRKPPRNVLQYRTADFESFKAELMSYFPKFPEDTVNSSGDHSWKLFES